MEDEHDTRGVDGAPAGDDPARLRLLRAAAQVFAEKGYARATTRAIAAAAGVNEVTLFRQFGTKLNLFMAVIEQFSPLADLAGIAGTGLGFGGAAQGPAPGGAAQEPDGSYRADLLRFAHLFQGVLAERRESVLMMLCEAQHLPELHDVVGGLPYRLRQMLAGYFRHQISRGVVRPLDPDVMAQAFLGMFFAHQLSLTVLAPEMRMPLDPEAVAEQFVDLFIAGTAER